MLNHPRFAYTIITHAGRRGIRNNSNNNMILIHDVLIHGCTCSIGISARNRITGRARSKKKKKKTSSETADEITCDVRDDDGVEI